MGDYISTTANRLIHIANNLYQADGKIQVPYRAELERLAATGIDKHGHYIASREIMVAPFYNGIYHYVFSFNNWFDNHRLDMLNLPGGMTGVVYNHISDAHHTYFGPYGLRETLDTLIQKNELESDDVLSFMMAIEKAQPIIEKHMRFMAYGFKDMLSSKRQIFLARETAEK
jgi:hypothetical protein